MICLRSRPRLLLPLCLAAAACTGLADTPGSDAESDPTVAGTPPPGEQLIAQPPGGWQRIGGAALPSLRRAEFIPADESEQDWRHRITFEAMVEDPLPDPITFVDLLAADRERECGTFERYPTFSGEENGYPTSVDLLVCSRDRDTDLSEVTLIKTIQGNEAFYIITRGRRGPPLARDESPDVSQQEVGAWALYLRSVSLCDPTRDGHRCPEAGSAPADDSE